MELAFKKKKTYCVSIELKKNMSGSLGEQEILWEHECFHKASVSTPFSSSP